MNYLLRKLYYLSATDAVVIVFYLLLTIANLIFYNLVHHAPVFLALNLVVISFVLYIAFLNSTKSTGAVKFIHYWYVAPLIYVTFKELYNMIKPIRQVDYDYLLIQIDHAIFGFHPTQMLLKISNPILTEMLQVVYTSFYFLPMILAVALYFRKHVNESEYVVFSVVYGFFVSYVAYFILPAVGPRFTLHDFALTNRELPGLWVTAFLRESINTGESIPSGTLNPVAIVQRDVFPSGHTMMTAIVMYLSIKFKSNAKYFLVPCGALLIFATVYLRYHYVIDVIAGLFCMVFSLWSGKRLYNYYQRLQQKPVID